MINMAADNPLAEMKFDHLAKDEVRASYNQFHNILRLFNVLPNLPFTTSETMCNYYL